MAILENITDSMISHYPLDEVSGDRFDAFGSNTLTDINTVGSVAGHVGGGKAAIFVNANQEELRAANSTIFNFDGTTDWTIGCWAWVDSLSPAGSDQIIVGKYSDDNGLGATDNDRQFLLFFDASTDQFRAIISETGSSNSADVSPTNNISANTWYHLILEWNATTKTLTLTIDNALGGWTASDVAANAVMNESAAVFKVGESITPTGDAFLDGRVDELTLWDRLLNPLEKEQHYSNGNGVILADYLNPPPAPVEEPTYYIHEGDIPAQESLSYGYTHGEVGRQHAAYCIVNAQGSDTVVKVTRVNVSKQAGMTSNTSNRNAYSIHTISAYTGGTDVTSTMFSMDTSKTVPANISLINQPTGYTKTDEFRKQHMIPQWTAFTDMNNVSAKVRGTKGLGGGNINLNLGALMDAGGDRATAPTQYITLRAGEGVGIEVDGLKLPHDCNVEITWTDGTDTFFGSVHVSPMYTDRQVVFFNESDSGEVVEIIDITVVEAGDTSEPVYDIMFCEKVHVNEGEPEELSIGSYDSSNQGLPVGVKAYRNLLVDPMGLRVGAKRAGADNWMLGRIMVTGQTTYHFSSLIQFNNWYQGRDIYKGYADNDNGDTRSTAIVIRPGEAIALMQRRAGQGGRKEFTIEFTAVQTPSFFPYPAIGGSHIIRSNNNGR